MTNPSAASNPTSPRAAVPAPEAEDPVSGGSSGEITLTLPWPPRITHQNGRPGHWHQRAAATKAYRKACAETAWRAGVTPIETWAVVSIEFQPPTGGKYPDKDGMIGGFKAGQDGLADAMGADDGEFWPDYIKGKQVAGGQIIAILRRLEIPG